MSQTPTHYLYPFLYIYSPSPILPSIHSYIKSLEWPSIPVWPPIPYTHPIRIQKCVPWPLNSKSRQISLAFLRFLTKKPKSSSLCMIDHLKMLYVPKRKLMLRGVWKPIQAKILYKDVQSLLIIALWSRKIIYEQFWEKTKK